MKKFAAAFALSFALSAAIFVCPALADEGHHEELTAEQLGTVHFSISCSPESQKTFEKGIALLHSFWYEEAQRLTKIFRKPIPNAPWRIGDTA